jgi:L-alanine-DL-glutamate epimerase-like enolase superfamily enzyme
LGIGENPWRTGVLRSSWAMRDGWVEIPAGPGLGVEVDEAFVRRRANEVRVVMDTA